MKRLIPLTGRALVALLFVVLSALLVISAQGRRFDLKHLRFVSTGTVVVRYNPADATLSLDGKTVEKQSPILLPRVLPGRYELSLTKAGYAEWNKTIYVEADRVVAEIGVVLFLDQPLLTPIIDQKELSRIEELFKSETQQSSLIHNERELWSDDQLITRL